MSECIVVLVTTGSEAEAETIARTLVQEQLVACVNVLSPIRSFYRWEGRIADDREWLLLIKTRAARFSVVAERVKALHSYRVPEIIALPIQDGTADYLQWVRQES